MGRKDVVDGKLARLLKSSKDLESLIESQRSDKVKEGVGYNAIPPPAADLYLSPKKDLSWTGLPEFVDDTVTDYSRPSPTIESTSEDGQNRNSSASENGEPTDSILSKHAVKFVKAVDRQAERTTTNKVETLKKPTVKYVEMNFPPVNRKLPTGNSNVSTVCCYCSRHVNSARSKAVINRRNRVKDVQASACWVWKPVKPNSASIILKRYDYVDVRGRSSEDKKKQRNKKLEDSEAEHQV
nr:hypothetical protein [Tanacetum cinerariifolium]